MSAKKKNTKSAYASLTGAKRAVPIVLFALAFFIAVCFIAPSNVGLGKYIGGFLLGLFSAGGYLVPLFLGIHAYFFPSDVLKKRVVGRIIFTLIVLFSFSALMHTIKSFSVELSFSPGEFYAAGKECSGGGFFGGIIGYGLMKVLGPVGLIIFAVLIFALYITYFFASGKSALAKLLLKILDKISDLAAKRDKKKKEKHENKEKKALDKKHPRISPKHEELYDDDFFSVDNGMSELRIDELGIRETRSRAASEQFPHLESKITHKSQKALPEEKDIFGDDYSEEDTLFEENPLRDIPKKESFEAANDSADAVFTKEFDPFDFEMNARLAARQADRVRDSVNSINEYAEPVRTVSDEELAEARRKEDFERKKRALLEAEERRRAMEEEAKRRENLREILKEEPVPPKAVYTQYSAYQKADEPTRSLEEELPCTSAADTAYTQIPIAEPEESLGSTVLKYTEAPYSEKPAVQKEDTAEVTKTEPRPNTIQYRPTESFTAETEFKEYKLTEENEVSALFEEPETLKLSRETLEDYTPAYEDADEDEDFTDGIESALPVDEDFEAESAEPIPDELQNPDISLYRGMFSVFSDDDDKEKSEALIVTNEVPLAEEDESYGEEDDVPFDLPAKPEPAAAPEPPAEKKGVSAPDYSKYKAPPLELLKKGNIEENEDITEETERNGEKLIETLSQFNLRASIRSVDIGPRITRYEIVPAKGVRVNSIMNLSDDIALSLAAEGIRMEAPIPGKSAIGVEIPTKHPQMVFLRDLLETDEFKNASSTTMACFGKDVTGNPVLGDIAKMPHLLIAGATGMGKSVCINAIMLSMLFRAHPDELKFIMIDPKMVEFNGYNGIPHLMIPVIIDVKQAAGALMWSVEQMEKRYEMFLKYSVRNLDGYNEKMRENPDLGKPLPKIVIVIDELNDLMLQARKPVEDLIMRIAQKARAAGIHLIIGTQRPSVDVITGVIKANIPSRIACKVSSFQDSKTILEQAGAEKLLDKGDMLFWPVGKPKPTRVQGSFVSDGEVEKIMNFLKSQNKGNSYDEEALAEINSAAQKCAKGSKGNDEAYDDDDGDDEGGYFNDPQFIKALELAVNQGKIATSLIQRKLSIGYSKAAKFIDIMEDQGFVSEPNGQKARDVLITKDGLHEILSRRSLD